MKIFVAATMALALMGNGGELRPIKPIQTDPAKADRIWAAIKAQDQGALSSLVPHDAEIIVDRTAVPADVKSFADIARSCNATGVRETSQLLSDPYWVELKLDCEGMGQHPYKAIFFFDADTKTVAIEMNKPIVFPELRRN